MTVQPITTLTMNPALDISSSVETVVPEHKLRCKPATYEPGGGGINVARAIRNLGGSATACSLLGGHTGAMLAQLLDQEGIHQANIPIQGHTRESFAVIEESSGQQYRFNLPGPYIQEQELQQLLATLEALTPPPAYLVVSGSLPPGVSPSIFHDLRTMCNRLSARLVVDTSGPALVAALEAGVFLIKPNYRELGMLLGQEIESDQELEEAARSLIRTGQSKAVLVSLGAAGALLMTAEGSTRFRPPLVRVYSRVGAGDSMVGGLVLALARGESLTESARFGVAAGTAAVMTPGAELCRREDAERLYRQMVVFTGTQEVRD